MRDYTFSRDVAECALRVVIEEGLSIVRPVQCVDLSFDRSECLKWCDKHGTAVKILDSTNRKEVDHKSIEFTESNYSVIERMDFNFIYVECTTEGASYFDCVFRKIARNGVFALSTSDDPALYGRPPEPALRCYSGPIVRTFYAPELAVRLILAAMARSAARFSKSIEVLLTAVIKNSVTILVRVKKGADTAAKSLSHVKTLVHCSVCEERAFLPNNDGFIHRDPAKLLGCPCAETSEGRTALALGPLWAASLGSTAFVSYMLPRAKQSTQQSLFLQELLAELRCDDNCTKEKEPESNGTTKKDSDKKQTSPELIPTEANTNSLKRKADSDDGEDGKKFKRDLVELQLAPAPPFYYNLHKHKPKDAQKLVKADKIIEALRHSGFRACRTHFDRAAVKTNATLANLVSVLSGLT